MEGEIDRLEAEKRQGWTFRRFGGCLKYSSYLASMNESQYTSNLLDENKHVCQTR